MADRQLLSRVDAFLAFLARRIILTLVPGSFVSVAFETITGVLALATVVLVLVISAYSYLGYPEGVTE